ncbi:MAG: alcohol dehydrogenase catalytic domain-containing protein [Elusimicrobiota bacterium]
MKVAVYYSNDDVRTEERPVHGIGQDEVLVKIMASGICGSDVMEWYRIKSAPRVLGHEISGVIEAVGAAVTRFKKGDRVFVTHHVPCNICRLCLKGLHTACDTLHKTNFDPGGFAQFVRVPAINVDRGMFNIPDSMSFEDATFIEPLACVIRGFRTAGFVAAESVLVLGSGIAGILAIALAKAMGAGRIMATDINPYRLKAAQRFGADMVFNASEDLAARIPAINDGHLAEFIAVSTGAPQAFMQALKCADKGGKVLFFAPAKPGTDIPFPLFDVWNNATAISSSYAAADKDLEAAITLIGSERIPVKDMITHRLPLAQTSKGFTMVASAQDSLKVIIEPHA